MKFSYFTHFSKTLLNFSRQKSTIGVIGAPFRLGHPSTGVECGPDQIRNTQLFQSLSHWGHEIKDYGNLIHIESEEDNSKTLYLKNVFQYNQRLSQMVQRILKNKEFCLTLGGDHSIGIGTVSGHTQTFSDSYCLLWIDAHADINTPELSPSGNLHGMPLSFHIPQIWSNIVKNDEMQWLKPSLSPDRLAYIGLRDVDFEEKAFLKKYNISAYSMRDVDEMGIQEVVSQALYKINPYKSRALHVSFDVDALDPIEAPSTGTPVRGGLTLREGLIILEKSFESGCLKGLDLVEVNTSLGTESQGRTTLEAATHLISSAFGSQRSTNLM